MDSLSCGTNHPLDKIEALLIGASNILYSDIERDSKRRASLDTAIDEALRIVQAWREDEETPVREREPCRRPNCNQMTMTALGAASG